MTAAAINRSDRRNRPKKTHTHTPKNKKNGRLGYRTAAIKIDRRRCFVPFLFVFFPPYKSIPSLLRVQHKKRSHVFHRV